MDHQRHRSGPEVIRVDFIPDKIRVIQSAQSSVMEAEIGRMIEQTVLSGRGALWN
jgi:hypothetical protein